MRRIIIPLGLLFLLLFNIDELYAQNSVEEQADSLKLLINTSPNDTLKIRQYKSLGDFFLSHNRATELLKIAEEGLILSEQLQYPKGAIQMTLFKAIALDINGKVDDALPLYNKSIQMAKTHGEGELEAKSYLNLGVSYHYMGNYELALENQLLAYNIGEELSKKDLAKLLNNIGVIYRLQKKNKRAEEIYLKSYKLKEELKDSLGMAATLMNLGLVYREMKSKENLSIQYLQKSQDLYQRLGRLDEVATVNVALGQFFLDKGDIPKAKKAFKSAWSYFKKNITQTYSSATASGLGEIAQLEYDYKNSETYLELALELSTKFENKKNIVAQSFLLSSVKDTLGKKGEAYDILKEAYVLNDTLNKTIRINAMEEMQAKFDVKEKRKELEISKLKLNEQTRQRNIFLFGLIGLALFTLTIFFLLRIKIKTDKKIAKQEEAIQKQEIIELQQKNKLLALNSMIEGQEGERLRIAKDLHDSLGGLLSTVKNHFSVIQKEIAKIEKLDLTIKTNLLIDEACIEVRRISHNMMPHALSISGLQGAVEDLGDQLIQEGYTTTVEVSGDLSTLIETKKVMIYRLIQEMISNIRKHSGAKTILIQLLRYQNDLKILIEDDGKGFDYTAAIEKGGLGLKSINSRVDFLDGTIDWDAQQLKGTTVNINIPI